MMPTGTPLPSPTISQKSAPQFKRSSKSPRLTERVLTLVALWAVAALPARAQDYTFTTLAGVSGSSGYNNSTTGSATNVPFFNGPSGVVVDSSGNYYVADSGNHTIRKVTPAGVVTTFAGTGGLAGNVDATGNAARFASPQGPAIDSAGNIYVADYGSGTIRKITSAGVVTTLAGNPGVAGSTDGTGTAALFNGPSAVAVDSSGNVFVADSINNRIRKVTPAGVVTTFAGSPVSGAGTLDGTGTAAFFSRPRGVAVDSAGNVYVADANNNTIRKITPAAVVKTIAGTAGTFGNTDATVAMDARFDFPASLAFDSAGNLFIADQANQTIRKLSTAGAVTTVAGKAATPGAVDAAVGTDARFFRPSGVACDSGGNIIVTDYSNELVRKIGSSSGNPVMTVAGVAGATGVQDGSGSLLISPSMFASPSATATDTAGNIYVTDTKNQVIRKITPAGLTSTLAGRVLISGASDTDTVNGILATFTNPAGIAVDNAKGNIIVADTGSHLIRVVTPAGVVTTLAGNAGIAGSVDATGTAATFNLPSAVAVDNNGNVYVADYGNHKIRQITPAGVVTTLAGTGAAGSADGTGTAASFKFPRGLAIDRTSTALYVADTQNHVIRRISLPGAVVTTIAGTAGSADSKDATGSAARFNGPNAVAVSSSGVIYVADTNNETIRAISPGGAVTTIASLPGRIGSMDGVGKDVRFFQPTGISVDAADTIYVADSRNNTIRRGVSSAGTGSAAGGYDGGTFDSTGNNGSGGGSGGGSTTPTGNGHLLHPGGISIDTGGNIYVADTANNSIKKITIGSDGTGTVTVFAGQDGTAGAADGTGTAASFNGPTGITNDGANTFYVTDTGNATIRKITAAGVVTTYAGSAGRRGNQDGVGTAALFSSPVGIDIDSLGNLYIADAVTATIRKINTVQNSSVTPAIPPATVTTFAGLAMTTGESDGVGSAARFNNPTGVTVDGNGTLYVADTNNNTIRRMNTQDITDGQTPATVITPAASVSTWAGAAGISGSFDGTGSYALFSNPTAVSSSRTTTGSVYVADTGNNLIRLVSPGAIVTTAAGNAGIAGYRDGTSSTALFNQPKGILSQGIVYVADTGNSSIRILSSVSVNGLVLNLPSTTTPTPTTPAPSSSSGGGGTELWFATGILLLFFRASRGRQRSL